MSETCGRPGCRGPATHARLRADPGSRGLNLNEPGVKTEFLCSVHAADVRENVGGPLWRIESGEQSEVD